MKKLNKTTLNLVFIVSFILLFSDKLYSQYYMPVDIRTPRNSQVPNTVFTLYELDQTFIAARDAYYRDTYPNAILLSSASMKYNCHAYAWHMSEGGDTVWIRYNNTITAEDIYWDDGSYEEVISENCATKVSYEWNHSAVTTETPDYYISKWGQDPLMYHHKNDVPMHRIPGSDLIPIYGKPDKFYARAIDVNSESELISALSDIKVQECCRKIHVLPNSTTHYFEVSGNLTIPAGVTLVIHRDKYVAFNGDINVNGTIVIDSSAGIAFNGGLTINGTLLIHPDSWGQFDGGVTVNNGTFQTIGTAQNKVELYFGSRTRLIINNSNTTSFQHTIFQGSRDVICVNGSNISFSDCEIRSHIDGIIATSSIISLNKTWLSSTMTGLCLLNHSIGYIRQNNIIRSVDFCIYGDETSYINAGDNITAGYNSFRWLSINIISWYLGTIPAWYNFWERGIKVSSNIDASYPLQNDPNPYIKLGDSHKTEEAEVESGLLLKRSVIKNDEPAEKVPGIEELDKATELLSNKKYDEALPEMYKLVDKYKDGFVGKRALVFIENIFTETDRAKDILPMLERYSVGESKVAEFAHYRKGYHYLHLREYDKGIEIMKGIEFSEEEADLRQARLYDLGVAYHDLLGKKAKAYDYFNELVRTYPDCQFAKITSTFYNITKDGYEKPVEDEEIIIPTETKLFANYPNPFNPSTVIKYQLADASQVSLKVYDVMGREVTILVNSYQNKGSYDVIFNANGFASGIYFYKLSAGGKQFINKMLLMK